MSAIAFLLGLLALSYMGSVLMSGRTVRGFGLPSGAEYVVLGFVLGPHALSVVSRSLVQTFEPVIICGISWLGLVAAMSSLRVGKASLHPMRLIASFATSMVGGGIVTGGVYLLALRGGFVTHEQALVVALGCGMVAAETTRHGVRWVAERYGIKSDLLGIASDLARGSVWASGVALSVLNAMASDTALPYWPVWARVLVTLGLGVVLGLTAALLLGREFRQHESWALLLGTALLGIGAAAALHFSPLATMMAMGTTLLFTSRHRLELRAMVVATETPVLLPVLVLTGVSLDVRLPPALLVLVGAAFALKLVGRLLIGLLIPLFFKAARGNGAALGIGMMSAGGMSVAAALSFAMRHPGELGNAVLLFAAAATVLGELVGPAALKRALGIAREPSTSVAPVETAT